MPTGSAPRAALQPTTLPCPRLAPAPSGQPHSDPPPCPAPAPAPAWRLQPDANFLRLRDAGSQLEGAWAAFAALRAGIGLLNWYYALNGVNILLMIAR